MEAVPRLPMLSFEMKISPVCPDFAMPFKRVRKEKQISNHFQFCFVLLCFVHYLQFISKYYGEDGDIYDREILELENLRNVSVNHFFSH